MESGLLFTTGNDEQKLVMLGEDGITFYNDNTWESAQWVEIPAADWPAFADAVTALLERRKAQEVTGGES